MYANFHVSLFFSFFIPVMEAEELSAAYCLLICLCITMIMKAGIQIKLVD